MIAGTMSIDVDRAIHFILIVLLLVVGWGWIQASRAEAHAMTIAGQTATVASNCVLQFRDHADSAAATSAALRRMDGGQWGTR